VLQTIKSCVCVFDLFQMSLECFANVETLGTPSEGREFFQTSFDFGGDADCQHGFLSFV
jgi:hypothetical protein